MQYSRLLTIRVKVHILFIVKHLWYTCIALCKVRVLFIKAVASFCGKDGDWGQVNTPTSPPFPPHRRGEKGPGLSGSLPLIILWYFKQNKFMRRYKEINVTEIPFFILIIEDGTKKRANNVRLLVWSRISPFRSSNILGRTFSSSLLWTRCPKL